MPFQKPKGIQCLGEKAFPLNLQNNCKKSVTMIRSMFVSCNIVDKMCSTFMYALSYSFMHVFILCVLWVMLLHGL